MIDTNTSEKVFRFMHLRKVRSTPKEVALLLESEISVAISKLPVAGRRKAALELEERLPEIDQELREWADQLTGGTESEQNESINRARTELTGDERRDQLRSFRTELSDRLLLATYAGTWSFEKNLIPLDQAQQAYKLICLLDGDLSSIEAAGEAVLRLPPHLGPHSSPAAVGQFDWTSSAAILIRLARTVEAVLFLDRQDALFTPGSNSHVPFSPTDVAVSSLDDEVIRLLQHLEIDLAAQSIDEAVDRLASEILSAIDSLADERGSFLWRRDEEVAGGFAALRRSAARLFGLSEGSSERMEVEVLSQSGAIRSMDVGVGELEVVRQHTKGYEAVEIAHVENIMSGEFRERTHRTLRSTEERTVTERERTEDEQTHLSTTDRFETATELQSAAAESAAIGFDLSLSGSYGPTVEFNSQLSTQLQNSEQMATANAESFAKEMMEQSVRRIVERSLETRSMTIVREFEESNVHRFGNEDQESEHIVGMYQFLDQLCEAQVFNYGKRWMFDIMVPEPAALLWSLSGAPAVSEDPTLEPPPPITDFVGSWADVNEFNYKQLQALYDAEDAPDPPARYQFVRQSVSRGAGEEDESGRPRSYQHVELPIESGYIPRRAKITALAWTDEDPHLIVQIGERQGDLNFDETPFYLQPGDPYYWIKPKTLWLQDLVPSGSSDGDSIGCDLHAWETATYSLSIELVCRRSNRLMDAWRRDVYGLLSRAYAERRREYEIRLQQAAAEARLASEEGGSLHPARKRQIVLQELKKHCISIVAEETFEGTGPFQDDEGLDYDVEESISIGQRVRFLEHCFEWVNLQYVFYPYFWSRKNSWQKRILAEEGDAEFRDFLQAGSARVLVPVRPGFEAALNYFLATGGLLWGEDEEPPDIGSELYLSIVDEIRERADTDGEIAVGDPWEVRLPTSLVMLRGGSDLPTWSRSGQGSWDWSAD